MIKEIKLIELSTNNSFDFKNCLFEDSCISGDLKYKNIKKWIRYAAVKYGDADKILKTKDNSALLHNKLKWEHCKYIDCIFSFKTFFNAFLRYYFNQNLPSYGELMDNFDSFFSNIKIHEFRKRCDLSKTQMDNYFEELNSFAKLTHTLGNYMPCPDNKYNRIKGGSDGDVYFQDRIELLYEAIIKPNNNGYLDADLSYCWKEWFENQMEKLFLNEILDCCTKLKEFECPSKKKGEYSILVMECGKNIIDYTEYLKNVNKLIINRTNMMINKMNSQ